MSQDLINPGAIPVPGVAAEELLTTASSLKAAGERIAGAGHDIKQTWSRLDGVYQAPEAGELFAAVDPVAVNGEDAAEALAGAADALTTFAYEADKLKSRLLALRSDAYAFLDSIAGDDDWRKDQDKVDEHDQLTEGVTAAVAAYEEAERECANAITGLLPGGTTFVAPDPSGASQCRPGEQVYGMGEVPDGAVMPWGGPQEWDAPFWRDAWDGVADLAVGLVQDRGGYWGLHGEHGWWTADQGFGQIGDNAVAHRVETVEGLGALIGVYGPEGWGTGTQGANAGAAWLEVAHSVVPWREWAERPGYTISQSVLNLGEVAVSTALLATGVGAPVGAAMWANRGMRAVQALSGTGHALPDAPHLPHTDTRIGVPASITRTGGPADQLATTQQIQDLVQRFRTDLDLADLSHPDGIVGALNDRHLVQVGADNHRAQASISDRGHGDDALNPGGVSAPQLGQ
ncbi:hypothetical protein [Marinitenerispora sediminis]|uniref:Uncharacterized protein n=1 Tax=Marinitenerispora sediminis TaxID=1931232 RepID=A0A368T5B0_9ACTN|nr:hypothetical protein [Marinitenerispora sediminis]RCV57268.1 hypothetical protein DEF28_01925 [Marinitenerispora sediminis]RCV58270.1 hypothetical protein DEF23_09290 [Marinitenerispora sediminis]RCV58492.1 hypothetical protein DEF24_13325 [Marinitenerispora sediminis]